jgi:hypothetical protein
MADRSELVKEAEKLKTLEEAFRWALSRTPPLIPGEVVIQDEYTHDVIFTSGSVYLVFDTT